MSDSGKQRTLLLVAIILGAAPLAFGLLRWRQTGDDLRIVWMASIATIFTAGVLAASIGRRRTRKAAYTQAMVILLISTLITGGTAFMLGATSSPGIWAVAFVLSALLAASSLFVWLSRSVPGHN